MTSEMRCEQVRELAPELALDIAEGEERDAALRHLDGCGGCRQVVSELSSVGDELLQLAPAQDPPAGFDSRVLARVTEPPRLGRRGAAVGNRDAKAGAVQVARHRESGAPHADDHGVRSL